MPHEHAHCAKEYNAAVKILALDTSTDLCSVALLDQNQVDARDVIAGQRNSELLLPMVDGLLRDHGLTVNQVDAIAFGSGPGSFTGLRIACGVAQCMAFGAGVPIVAVGTLLALAEASLAERAVCCLDARMGEVYHAAYEKSGDDWTEIDAPGLYKPFQVPPLTGAQWTGCGSGFAVHGDALRAVYAASVDRVAADLVPHARQIASVAARQVAAGRTLDAALAVPIYVRDKVALRVDER